MQDLLSLLQQREREYQLIFSNLGISCSSRIIPLSTSNERERKGLETSLKAFRKEGGAFPSGSPIPQSFPMKRSNETPHRIKESSKYPVIPSPVTGNDSQNTKHFPTMASSICPMCQEGPYGLMVCQCSYSLPLSPMVSIEPENMSKVLESISFHLCKKEFQYKYDDFSVSLLN